MNDYRLRVMFVCRASARDGMGHLFRCHSLIEETPDSIDLYLVINGSANHFFTSSKLAAPERIITQDKEFIAIANELKPDILIFDLNNLDKEIFATLAKDRFTVCLSPLCQHISSVHQVFHRTSYLPGQIKGPQVYAGLDYAIISYNCQPIPDSICREHLNEPRLSIGISMGGGDAANKTLQVLKSLSRFSDESIIWVFLGAGYSHSYDRLVQESYYNQRQEVVLVKTNRSLWQVLRNCHLIILSGGITSYDAVYAGMPALNLLLSPDHSYSLKELVEKGACLNLEVFGPEALERLPETLSAINKDRDFLWKIHKNSQKLIDGKGSHRVWQRIMEGSREYHLHL